MNLNDLRMSLKAALDNMWARIDARITAIEQGGGGGVTGVKGDAEANYRTGNVNLTPANIGAVANAGDTMTGPLTFEDSEHLSWPLSNGYSWMVRPASNWGFQFLLLDSNGNIVKMFNLMEDGHMHLPSPLEVPYGGTGATTPAQVRENIGAASSAKLATYVRPNLLDNWYFVGGGSQQGGGQFPINQRGQTSYNSNQYGPDRWLCYNAGIGIASGYIYPVSATGTPVMTQIIENPSSLYGKTLTASVLFEDGTLGTGTATYSDSGTTMFWDQTNSQMYMDINGYFQFYHTSSYGVVAAKLEIGDTQTLAHQENGVWVLNEVPNYAEELAKCQRYYQIFKTQSFRPVYGVDFRPVMASDMPTLGTYVINNETYYTASSDL